MKCLALLLTSLFTFTSNTHAQIYADVTVSYGASPLGTFRIQLHHDKTPRTVANFIGLATGARNWIDPETGAVQIGKPYYDGLTFHRLIHTFMIQGGDPLGTGNGGPGYIFQDEFDHTLSHNDYIVSMANSGICSNGSQFFITLSAPTHLDHNHSIFGEVIDDATYPNSRALIDGFKSSANFPTDGSDLPTTPITIDSVTFNGPSLATFDIHSPALKLPEVSSNNQTINHDSTQSTFSLTWDIVRKIDYSLYYSTDLDNWAFAGNLLSMDNTPDKEIGITGIATAPATFYISSAVDYNTLPEAPQNLLTNGSVLTIETGNGSLSLTFDGNGAGSWTFDYPSGSSPSETGDINSVVQYPTLPAAGTFLNQSSTYARYMSFRDIDVTLDGSAGPYQLTEVDLRLSFHELASGWFDASAQSNSSGTINFKNEFTHTSAP